MYGEVNNPVNIVVVDNSSLDREMIIRLFQSSQSFQVIGSASNGVDAVRLVKRLRPDVITLDIHMPKMDGLEATRQIMREMPIPVVILSAGQSPKDMDLTFMALQAGAVTAVKKPDWNDVQACEKLVQTIHLMANTPVIHHWGTRERVVPPPEPMKTPGDLTQQVSSNRKLYHQLLEIRAIGIAASTGGPSAIATILGSLPAEFPLPVLVVQHISPGFTRGLAGWLKENTRLEVVIARNGDRLRSGRIILAPDDQHLQIGEHGTIELSKAPAYKGLRPSANYLFHSLARTFGRRALGIVLTGMGDDGAEGAQALFQAGGLVLAQDEQTSVVYGMPQQVVVRQAAHQVLNLEQIGQLLCQIGDPHTHIVRHS